MYHELRKRGTSAAAAPSTCLPSRRLWLRPHLFQLIEGAHLGPEDVDDHVACVDQHPVAMRHAFDADLADAGLVQVFDHAIGDRAHLPAGSSGGYDDEVGERTLAAEIDGDGILGLHIVDACEDQAKGLLGVKTHLGNRFGGATGAGPGACRCGQGWPFLSLSFTASHVPVTWDAGLKIGMVG